MNEYLDKFNQSLVEIFDASANVIVNDIYFLDINECEHGHSNSKACNNNPFGLVSKGFKGSWK